MATYRISGIWVDSNAVITHYALHTVGTNSTSKAIKASKAQVIALLENNGNTASTWVWNYSKIQWDVGEIVKVVNSTNGKYLRSNPDTTSTDNLRHLIYLDWFPS